MLPGPLPPVPRNNYPLMPTNCKHLMSLMCNVAYCLSNCLALDDGHGQLCSVVKTLLPTTSDISQRLQTRRGLLPAKLAFWLTIDVRNLLIQTKMYGVQILYRPLLPTKSVGRRLDIHKKLMSYWELTWAGVLPFRRSSCRPCSVTLSRINSICSSPQPAIAATSE